MDQQNIARLVIGLALILLIIGVVIYFFGDKLTWIGNLPGDIRIKKENFNFYFPITTMVLFSVLLNVLYRLIARLGGT